MLNADQWLNFQCASFHAYVLSKGSQRDPTAAVTWHIGRRQTSVILGPCKQQNEMPPASRLTLYMQK